MDSKHAQVQENHKIWAASILNNRIANHADKIDHGEWLEIRDKIAQDYADALAAEAERVRREFGEEAAQQLE